MLSENELKILKGTEYKERKKGVIYVIFGVGIFVGIFSLSIGFILKEEGYKILGFIWGLISIMGILAVREQLKLFRIIKKLQKELEGNKQATSSTETRQ